MADSYIVYKHSLPREVSNKKNDMVYIGVTGRNPIKRWNKGNGYRAQILFYRAILKYGWDNFKHEILHDRLSKDEAYQLEKELILKFKSNNRKFGYNQSAGGYGGCLGYRHTNEIKKKISATKKQRHYALYGKDNPSYGKRGELSPKSRKLAQYSLSGEFIKLWNSMSDVYRECGFYVANIVYAIKTKGTHKGYMWRYFNGSTENIKPYVKKATPTKIIIQISLGDEVIKEWKSIKEASDRLHITEGNICKCCKGKAKTAGGYKWKYKEVIYE